MFLSITNKVIALWLLILTVMPMKVEAADIILECQTSQNLDRGGNWFGKQYRLAVAPDRDSVTVLSGKFSANKTLEKNWLGNFSTTETRNSRGGTSDFWIEMKLDKSLEEMTLRSTIRSRYVLEYECRRRSVGTKIVQASQTLTGDLSGFGPKGVCSRATINGQWETSPQWLPFVEEAKRRGLDCGVTEVEQVASVSVTSSNQSSSFETIDGNKLTVLETTASQAQPLSVQPQPQSQSQQVIPQLSLNITSTDPKEAIEEIDLKITLYAKIANNLPQTEAGYRVQQEVLDKKIEELKKLRESLAASYLSKYNTPIYPVNINLGTTAFRYSEIFPSIPYYIPGTKEVGEFLVQPVVSNKGQLTYEFTFLDPSAKYNKEREQIVVVNTDMGSLIDGLDKVREWTETAEKQNVRRRFEKVASCFPKADCGVRQVGKASTEVVFQIYENGSTSGKLQRVKGEFVSGYNMSVESTVLLGAYLKYMRDIGEQEFKVGSMTEKDLDSMFK